MKKLAFTFSLFVVIFLVIRIIKILYFDLTRLTEYGIGYLTGKLLLLGLFLIFGVSMYRRIVRTRLQK